MRFLITGGAGFIGSSLVRQLLAEKHEVLNLDCLSYAANPLSLKELEFRPQYHFVCGNILDRPLVRQLLKDFAPDCLINVAAETHVDRSIDNPESFIRTNIEGTYNLLQACLEKQPDVRFVHVSTDEVYGSVPEGESKEEDPYRPNSPYAASKAASDHLVRSYHQTYGLKTLVTHGSNTYGPRQFPEKLIPLHILNALQGKPMPVYGNGENIRDWLYVDDHAKGIITVAEHGRAGEIYNIGGDNLKPNIEVVKTIAAILDQIRPLPVSYAKLITFVQDRPGHDWRYALNSTKIQRQLNFKPQADFYSNLKATILWYIENPDWLEAIPHYRQERLGLKEK